MLPPIPFPVETSRVFTASFAPKRQNLHCYAHLAAQNGDQYYDVGPLFLITRNQFNKRERARNTIYRINCVMRGLIDFFVFTQATVRFPKNSMETIPLWRSSESTPMKQLSVIRSETTPKDLSIASTCSIKGHAPHWQCSAGMQKQ